MTDPHRECWELLPWLVNERLSREDAARVGKHLAECAQCRAELDSQRQLRDAMRNEDALVLAPQASLQKLMQRIDADVHEDEAAPEVEVATPRPQPAARIVRRPHWLAIAASVQAIAISALIGTLGWQWLHKPYVTQSSVEISPPVVAPGVVHGPVLRTVFRDDVTVGQIHELLGSIDAQIVAGPAGNARVFTLALSGTHDDAAAKEISKRLLADPRVSFAEVAIVEDHKR